MSRDSVMKYLADSKTIVVDHCLVVDRPWADETITVSVERRMGGGRRGGRSLGKREVVGREGEQRKKGRTGERGNERGKKR